MEKFFVRHAKKEQQEATFGPLCVPFECEIKPLTVLIGPQGTGKSLVSQFVYFFRNWRFLLATFGEEGVPETLVRGVVERLRSGERALAGAFVEGGTVRVGLSSNSVEWTISLNPRNRRIVPLGRLNSEIEKWLTVQTWREGAKRQAVFVPAERVLFSKFINTPEQGVLYAKDALSIPALDFNKVVIKAGEALFQKQEPRDWPSQVQVLYDRMKTNLRGEIQFANVGPYPRRWLWVPVGGEKGFEIEMASSGQIAGWPVYQVLMGLLLESDSPSLALHVEEPEIHLYPTAQRHLMEALIYMVNQGYRVFVTTHSLFILRTLNLAMQRFRYGQGDEFTAVDPKQVAAYYASTEGKLKSIVTEQHYIDESFLAEEGDRMGTELYNLWYTETAG